LSNTFEEASNGIAPITSDPLNILRRVADDGTRSFRGCLGFFSSTQCTSIASIIGSVSWSTVVYPLWDKIIYALAMWRWRPPSFTLGKYSIALTRGPHRITLVRRIPRTSRLALRLSLSTSPSSWNVPHRTSYPPGRIWEHPERLRCRL